jgi:hypothetical protein
MGMLAASKKKLARITQTYVTDNRSKINDSRNYLRNRD